MLNPQAIGANEEQFEYFTARGKKQCQYDYRDKDGTLFSCVKSTLKECLKARKEWVNTRKHSIALNSNQN